MPTHYRGSLQERAALDTYIKLMRAAESVTARLEPLMRAADLTVGQFGALEALLHLGPLCQRDLGHKLLRSGGNTTIVVGNLARRGTRAPDAAARRSAVHHSHAHGQGPPIDRRNLPSPRAARRARDARALSGGSGRAGPALPAARSGMSGGS